MKLSKRNKMLIGGGGLLGLVIVALLLAPAFIDLDGRKPEIAAEVKKATGRDLAIDGPVSLSLLPVPEVSVSGVRFSNMPGAANAKMVEVKSVVVRPSLLALLVGRVEVSSITLEQPKIVLEIDAEGKPNWEFPSSIADAKTGSSSTFSFGELVIKEGTLVFNDPKSGISVTADKANLRASVGAGDGPYALSGKATVNGAPLTFDFSVGAKASDGYATSASLSGGGGTLGIKGTVSELGSGGRLVGTATASATSLDTFAGMLLGLTGRPVPPLPPLLAGKFSFDGAIDLSRTALASKEFKLTLGQESGSGALAVKLSPALAIDGKFSMAKLDLDRLLAGLTLAPVPANAATPPGRPSAAPSAAAPAVPAHSFLATLDARLALDAGEITYHNQEVRDVALELDARGGAVALPKLQATLPGDMVIDAKSTLSGDPARPAASGTFSLVAPKLRDTLAWLGIDVSAVPADKLKSLSLKGRMTSSNGDVQVPEAALQLDDLKATGGLTITFAVPLSVVAQIDLATFDLDSFLDTPAASQKPAPATATPSTRAALSTAPAPAGTPILGLKAKIAKLIYRKQTIGGVDADIGLQGNTLRLNEVSVSDFATARFAVRGVVVNYDTRAPGPDIAFNFEATDMTQVLKAAGLTAPEGLGKVTASGGIAGNVESLKVIDIKVAAVGETAAANGTLSMPGAASGPPRSVAWKGSLTLNDQTIEGSVDAKLTGRPRVDADLKTTLLDLDKMREAASLRAAPATARKQTAAPGKAPDKTPDNAIDTSALRSFDGSFKLTAASFVSSPLRLTNADIAATLKDGVLTVSKFKSGLYGGTFDMTGALDASRSKLAFDFKGDANNISLSEMLRASSGTNMFGGAVKITVDGKLNANDILLKGSGSTADELKHSMTGGAALGGFIFIGADKTLTNLGAAATGVVGGVLDETLGTALGIVGQRNSQLNVGGMLNAVSLVLDRFANRNNSISGKVDIAGGVLTDKSLAVQGDRSTASVRTRTDLAASTTDTTVDFRITEDSSSPYLVATARGPLSSPSFNISRGSAKDPPGFVNTLERGASDVTQPVKSLIPNIQIPNIFGR